MRKFITDNFYRYRQTILLMIVLIVAWQLFVNFFHISSWILPSPIQILLELGPEWHVLKTHLLSSLYLIIFGFVMGTLCGIGLALFMHLMPSVRKAIYPLLLISQNIPIIALAPLLVIWFGFGLLPKLIVIVLICFFPVSMNTLDGLNHTDRTSYLYMQIIGASNTQIFFKLEFPYALPYLFSGLKISATYSVLGAVIAEWLGASKGIGVYMLLSKNSFQTSHVFLAIGFIIFIALTLNALISFLENQIIRWNHKTI